MSINVRCAKCKQELQVPGGLAFSPPEDYEGPMKDMVSKSHLCILCWDKFVRWLVTPEEDET